jgi:hypothetical protein
MKNDKSLFSLFILESRALFSLHLTWHAAKNPIVGSLMQYSAAIKNPLLNVGNDFRDSHFLLSIPRAVGQYRFLPCQEEFRLPSRLLPGPRQS